MDIDRVSFRLITELSRHDSSLEKVREILQSEMSHDLEIQIKHPTHYNSHPSGVECIEVATKFDYCLGNAIKYLWRQGLKEGQPSEKDLKKAEEYLKLRTKYVPGSSKLTLNMVAKIIDTEIASILSKRKEDAALLSRVDEVPF